MGAGSSAGLRVAIENSSSDDVAQALKGLSPEDRQRLTAALGGGTVAPSHLIPSVAGKPGGKTVLVIAASPMGAYSATNNVGKAFCAAYQAKYPDDAIKVLDISGANALPPFTAARVQAKFKCYGGASASDDVEEWQVTKKIIAEFLAADKYVFLAPMWNFWIPNQLKHYIDHIVQPNSTFTPDNKGLVTGKPAMIIRAAGGVPVGSEMDTGCTYLKAVLGFIGFTDVRLLGISGTADQGGLQALLEAKSKEAAEMATTFEFDAAAKLEVTNAVQVAEVEPAAIKEGSKVLFISSSPMGDYSATLGTGKRFLGELAEKTKAEVTMLDLSDGKMEAFTAARVQAKFATWGGGKDATPDALKKEWSYTTSLIDQFKAADVYVFAVPFWNLAMPHTLKRWVDHIVQPHQTFNPADYKGLLDAGKRAFVISCSAGGLLGSPMDHSTPYLQQILGMVGVEKTAFEFVKGTDGVDDSVNKLKALVCL